MADTVTNNPPATFIPAADTEISSAQTTESTEDVNESGADGVSASAAVDRENADVSRNLVQTNGGSDKPKTTPETKPSGLRQDAEDTEMRDIEEPTESADSSSAPPRAANGTPATNKRASLSASSKKKSSAVPEHKSKKLNKKKSKPLTNLDAQAGDYYFARMKGHPPWPSIICDEEMLPHSLLSTRPVTAAQKDGTYKKADYADGGKRVYERTYPVMFLHTNEFAWIPNTELTPFESNSDAIRNPVEKGKSKQLLSAYAKAAEGLDLDAFKFMLAEHDAAVQEDVKLQEERAAKKAEKSKKSAARKSSEAVVDEDDEMELDDDTGTEKPKSKKRKKTADSDVDEKPAKTPKTTTTKLKLSTPKQPTDSATKKKPSKSKSKAAKSGSDDDAQTPKVEEKPLSPAAVREIKEKKVLYYRHKLQRGFLSRDTVPKPEEMKSMSDFLSELETYPDLEGSIIRATKIHKVLKQMIKLENIPLEEEFNFKDRAGKLLGKWNETLSMDGPSEDKGEEKGEDKTDEKPGQAKTEEHTPAAETVPTTNGQTEGDQKAEAETAESATAPEVEEPNLENRIGTTAEGEKEAEAASPVDGGGKAKEPTTDEKRTDAPAIDTAPAGEYQPPPEAEVMDTAV